ncbi:hypothetical protein ACFQZT_21865 [Paenibacillus sp. GCM10027628]
MKMKLKGDSVFATKRKRVRSRLHPRPRRIWSSGSGSLELGAKFGTASFC